MGNLSFTAVDVIVALVLLGSGAFAFMRGFVHEVLAVTAWVGAVFATLYGLPYVQPFAREHIPIALAADAAAGLAIFLATLFILSLVTKAASDKIKDSALNSVDSSLGFVYGLVRGAVLLTLAYMLGVWIYAPEEPPPWIAEARTRPWLEQGAVVLRAMAPDDFQAAEDETRKAAGDARRVMEVERTLRSLTNPEPKAKTSEAGADGPPGGYDDTERRNMDRLFQTNQTNQ